MELFQKCIFIMKNIFATFGYSTLLKLCEIQLVFFLYICLTFTGASAALQDDEAIDLEEFNISNATSAEQYFNTRIVITNTTTEASPEGVYGYQKHPHKIAAVVVYCIAALVGIFGVLIKYFVMQHEKLQAQAQLEYQQLQTMKTY